LLFFVVFALAAGLVAGGLAFLGCPSLVAAAVVSDFASFPRAVALRALAR
jgi:hypothetical protein